jgi:hypothetical protein
LPRGVRQQEAAFRQQPHPAEEEDADRCRAEDAGGVGDLKRDDQRAERCGQHDDAPRHYAVWNHVTTLAAQHDHDRAGREEACHEGARDPEGHLGRGADVDESERQQCEEHRRETVGKHARNAQAVDAGPGSRVTRQRHDDGDEAGEAEPDLLDRRQSARSLDRFVEASHGRLRAPRVGRGAGSLLAGSGAQGKWWELLGSVALGNVHRSGEAITRCRTCRSRSKSCCR